MKNTINSIMNTARNALHSAYMARRQAADLEQSTQEKAGVFQVTGIKEQAMFWNQALLAR